MPNDVQDWTVLTQVNLQGGISKLNLGDVGAPSLQADLVTETLGGTAGFGGQAAIALASFKAAAASVIAKVGTLGVLAVGTANSVSPTFGQSPTAGNLLVAWVTAGSADPTTVAAGWVEAVTVNFNGQFAAIWYKPNAAGADAAPTFTVGAGSNLMSAQLGEFSGVATSSPLDQVGSTQVGANPYSVVGGAVDAAFGDLVLTVTRMIEVGAGTASFTDTINNGGTVVQAGTAQVGSGGNRVCNGTYTIIPAATVAQPLGVADWDVDASGVSAPGVGVAPSIVMAATPGKTYHVHDLDASIEAATGAKDTQYVQVLDGTSVIWTHLIGAVATVGAMDRVVREHLSRKGTTGNSMTARLQALGANSLATIDFGAYLR